jgi:hypothetical protein
MLVLDLRSITMIELFFNQIKHYLKLNRRVLKFKEHPDETKRVYLSIIRKLTKQKYKIFSKEVRIKVDGEKVRIKLYTFITNK